MSANNLTVWGIGGTRAMRVHWTLMELGVDYETKAIRTREPETQTEAMRFVASTATPSLPDPTPCAGQSAFPHR